MQFVLLNDCN